MIFNTLEQILIQFSFVIFFLVTLFSWVRITLYENRTFYSKSNSEKQSWRSLSNLPTCRLRRPFSGIFLGFISVTGLCIIRWNLSDHLPLSNLYESSLFLAWSLIFLYLLLKIKIESEWLDAIISPIILMTTTFSTLGLPKQLQEATALVPALQSNWLMMHVTMMILSYGALLFGSLLAVTLLTLTFTSTEKNYRGRKTTLWNPSYADADADALPSLRSSLRRWSSSPEGSIGRDHRREGRPWVSVGSPFGIPGGESQMIDELAPGGSLGFAFNAVQETKNLVENLNKSFSLQNPKGQRSREEKIRETKIISKPTIAVTLSHPIDSNWSIENPGFLKLLYLQKYKAVLVNQIDYWSYRIIGIGFPLLTLGILSGAVWANEAWGSYWNWDPKETWAFITWVIFAIYLHIRITKGWNGTKPALVALLGFFVVWICYLGVNLLGKGLHSYGWLN